MIRLSKDIISNWKSDPKTCISYQMRYDILGYTYPILSSQPNIAKEKKIRKIKSQAWLE